jgi:hypothetical protein
MRSAWTLLIFVVTAGIAGSVLLGARGTAPAAAPLMVPSPTPAAAAPPTAWQPPSSVIGTWERRDALLIIAPSGAARFAWRTSWCGADVAPPCDTQKGNTITFGARADLRLINVETNTPLRVQGRITSVNVTGFLEPGPIEIEWISPDLLEMRQAEWTIELCRPPREPNFCDLTAGQSVSG